jgi:hypothetical protein
MLSSIINDKLAKEHLILLPEASLKLALHSLDLPLDVFSVCHRKSVKLLFLQLYEPADV